MEPGGYVMFYARLAQILSSAVVLIASMVSCFTHYDNFFHSFSAACSALILYSAGIGMFAFRRPRDIHWHITLTLDWLSLPLGLLTVAWATLAAIWSGYLVSHSYAAATIAIAVCSYITVVATLVPIIRTHRLKKAGKLPAPGAKRVDSYHLGGHLGEPEQTRADQAGA